MLFLYFLSKYRLKIYAVDNPITKEKFDLMLNENKIDIISICTHASNHHEIVKEAIKNKILGIFIEKPIANNLKNALKIIELCKKNKVKQFILGDTIENKIPNEKNFL